MKPNAGTAPTPVVANDVKKEVKCEPGTDPHRPKEMKGPESEQVRELRAQLKLVSN